MKKSLIFILVLILSAYFAAANPAGTNVVISEVLYNGEGSLEAGKEWIEL